MWLQNSELSCQGLSTSHALSPKSPWLYYKINIFCQSLSPCSLSAMPWPWSLWFPCWIASFTFLRSSCSCQVAKFTLASRVTDRDHPRDFVFFQLCLLCKLKRVGVSSVVTHGKRWDSLRKQKTPLKLLLDSWSTSGAMAVLTLRKQKKIKRCFCSGTIRPEKRIMLWYYSKR